MIYPFSVWFPYLIGKGGKKRHRIDDIDILDNIDSMKEEVSVLAKKDAHQIFEPRNYNLLVKSQSFQGPVW